MADAFADLVHGDMRFGNEDIDDLVILRSDGTPTYNLVVVIDDHEMAVTHVIRGDDHLNNTPKQQMLYEALELPVPHFAHLPIILGNDGGKMSKRHGDTSVGAYRDKGFLHFFAALEGLGIDSAVELVSGSWAFFALIWCRFAAFCSDGVLVL